MAAVDETSAGGVVINNERTKIALIGRLDRRGRLLWSLPKGHIEEGETPEQTAVREVAEEVGLTVTPVALIGERNHPDTRRHLVYVACETDTAAARVLDTDELADLEWCAYEALTRRVPKGFFGPVQDYLRDHLGRQHK